MRIFSCLVIATMLSALVAAQQGKADDEAVIRRLFDQYVAAFNKKDAKAVAQIWAEDGEYTSLTGRSAKGRSELEGLFRDLLAGPYKDARIQLVTQSVRFLAPDAALSNATWELSGARGPDGGEKPAIRTVSLSVTTKRSGQWLLVSSLPMAVPAPAAK